MSVLDTLITDRSAADVIRWRELDTKGYLRMTPAERVEWNAAMKGTYDYTDLNRVGEAIAYVAAELAAAGYTVSVSPKTDWARGDVPTPAQYAQYLTDVATLRTALTLASSVPSAPTKVTERIEANDIETILLAVDDALTRISEATRYCGVPYCGTDIF